MFECIYLTFVYSFADRVRFFLRDAARDRGVYGSIIITSRGNNNPLWLTMFPN